MEPTRPDEKPDAETDRIVRDRLATFDQDKKSAVDARQAISAIQRNLKQPAPR